MNKKGVLLTSFALFFIQHSLFSTPIQSAIYTGLSSGAASPEAAPSAIHFSKSKTPATRDGTLGYHHALAPKMLTGLEAHYSNFGKTHYTGGASVNHKTGSFKNSAIQILLTGTYLMDNGLNTFLKVGQTHEKTNFQLTNAPTIDIQKWIPAIAAGLGCDILQDLKLYGQYERTLGKNWAQATATDHPSEPLALNIFTMGLNYTLPI